MKTENERNSTDARNKTGRRRSTVDKIMKAISSVLFLGLVSLLAFSAQSGNAQVFNEKLGTGALQSNTTGSYNVALGDYTLLSNTTGSSNAATGTAALFYNATGNENTASGTTALFYNTTGYSNTASGVRALYQNTEGFYNTASGFRSLFSNHTGNYNTASGVNALWANSTGTSNTASGYEALYFNNGNENTASGTSALYYNTTGYSNTASGVRALYQNTQGFYNTATGFRSLFSNNMGSFNTASGVNALWANSAGNENTANGYYALYSNTTGSDNIALGYGAGADLTTGSNNIDIGNPGVAGESNTIRIGLPDLLPTIYIAGIYGSVATNGTQVYVNSDGRLGTGPSSRRFKKDIADMDMASQVLLSLRPVSFHYKEEFDSKGIAQFGLVAEEVAKISPDLVLRDGKGDIYSVRYEAVNAMLLNEFLKEHRKVEQHEVNMTHLQSTVAKQEAIIAQQQKESKVLAERLDQQALQIRKVSDQLELSRPAPQLTSNGSSN
ncbi:MAG TPA: tail fiber domain-containing protein [Candidatus Udaeobacter sp.]|jgi:hypothetical protein|nr:tail fiber domain-containing protein [Candidatus Udaeobacter sp.]